VRREYRGFWQGRDERDTRLVLCASDDVEERCIIVQMIDRPLKTFMDDPDEPKHRQLR
jgi:hypothetical protein